MKNIWNKYIESWKFAIEFLLRFDSEYSHYSGKDWIKGVLLSAFHLMTVGLVLVLFIQVAAGQ